MEEITAEYAVQELVETPPLKCVPKVTIACKTDLGRVRENNEDKFEYFLAEDERTLAARGSVFLVCDGMGGHAAGQIASELAAKTFIDVYLNHPAADAAVAMASAAVAANRFVYDVAQSVPGRRGMGTTLSGLILLQDQAFTVQVGDSRVYRLRGGELRQLTGEHTWIEEAVSQGWVSREDAAVHPNRHMLLRAVGAEPNVEPEVRAEEAQVGDVYLLCSDGLTNHVGDEQIAETIGKFGPSEACWKLVSAALLDGGSDNCTAMVVRLDGFAEPQPA